MTNKQTLEVSRKYVMNLTEEAHSILLGMVEHCLKTRACMGMDEGFSDLETEEEHDFVKELRVLLDQPAQEVKQQGEVIYQIMYLGDGGGGWCDAEKDSYDVKVNHPKHWQTRIVYTEQPAPTSLTVWYGSMPESNGKTNWTAILHRKGGEGSLIATLSEGITISRSEYPDRVRYEADCMRHLIGELKEAPDILVYDTDLHSGYKKQGQD